MRNKEVVGGRVSERFQRPHVNTEGRSDISRRGWDKRGRVFPIALPFLSEGRTVAQICEATGLKPRQISNARERLRARGLLRRPTKEEARRAKSIALIGKPSPMLGKTHKPEAIFAMTLKRRRGKILTDDEKERISLLVRARQIPNLLKQAPLKEVFEKAGRKPCKKGEGYKFLMIFYAARLCLLRNQEIEYKNRESMQAISMRDVDRFYDSLNPKVIDRIKDEITFILEKTTRPSRKGVIFPDNSTDRFRRAAAFYSQFPE